MGCGGSKEKEEGLEVSFDSRMEIIGIESIDGLFKEASASIENLEAIREVIIDNRLDTIIHTGACSHIKPDIEHCFRGLLLKISADNKGSFISAGFDIDLEAAQFLTLTGERNTQEAKDALQSLTSYLKGIWEIKDRGQDIYNNVKAISDKIMASKETLIEECKNAFQDNPFNSVSAVKKLIQNFDKVNHLVRVAPKIPEELMATLNSIKGFPSLIKNAQFISKVDEEAKKAIEAGNSHAYEICYFTYDLQSRYGKNQEDGHKYWIRKREAKKAKKNTKKKN
jgi:hypothetical protein